MTTVIFQISISFVVHNHDLRYYAQVRTQTTNEIDSEKF